MARGVITKNLYGAALRVAIWLAGKRMQKRLMALMKP
jgi:hypothetical protein